GPLALSARGRADLIAGDPLPVRAEVQVELAPVPCGALPSALPGSPGKLLLGLTARGELAGRLTLAFDRSEPAGLELDLDVDERCRITSGPPRADVRRLLPAFDHRRPDGQVMRIGDGADSLSLAELPRHTVGAFVAAEDARFYRHNGFDLDQ